MPQADLESNILRKEDGVCSGYRLHIFMVRVFSLQVLALLVYDKVSVV
jgi:hypothetical protein